MNSLKELKDKLKILKTFSEIKAYIQRQKNIEYLKSGLYSDVYIFKKYVIKISKSEDYNKLRRVKNKNIFNMYFVPIVWIHKTGKLLICYKVDIFQCHIPKKVSKKMIADLKKIKYNLIDLHSDNLVTTKLDGRYKCKIVDYGCLEKI